MKLSEFKKVLAQNPEAQVRFELPNGELAPVHLHVTEVARIDKRFIGCGGTFRNDSLCRLQTWFADDLEHRLTAGKLAKIFNQATALQLTDDLEVDIEHEVGFITQFPITAAKLVSHELVFHLTKRHTACLAMEKCNPPAKPRSEFDLMKFDFRETPASGKCCA